REDWAFEVSPGEADWDYRFMMFEGAEQYLGTNLFNSLPKRFAKISGVTAVEQEDRESYLIKSILSPADLENRLWASFQSVSSEAFADREISYWIQHADFSTTDGTPVSLAEALEVFHGHDWTEEMDQARRMIESRIPDVCPPGIGYFVVNQEDQLLHVLPKTWDSVEISCSYPVEKSSKGFLGLIPPRKFQLLEEVSSENFPVTEVKHVITFFFERNYYELVKIFESH
ncbi:MAG TPA: hypothetical protein VK325_12415, partial [Pseudoxanthomonas sp.]|nr:hypothetical protein [Pseudoxanthomonas sp.]